MAMNQNQTRYMFGLESVYGTAVTPTTVLSRVQSANLSPGDNGFIYERGLGEGLNVVKTNIGIFNCGGSLTFNVSDFTFLQSWIGVKSGDGSSGTPYTLSESSTIDVAGNVVRPFTFEEANTTESSDSVFTYSGCVGTSFSLSGSIGTPVQCTANFIGQKSKHTTSATSYTASTATSYVTVNSVVKWGSTPSSVSGVRDWTINFSNGVTDSNRDITSRFMNIPVLDNFSYTGTLSIIMSSGLASTIIENFYGQTASNGPVDGSTTTQAVSDLEFKIELANGTNSATIWLDNCSIDNLSKPINLNGGLVLLSVAFTAKSAKDNALIKWWS